MGENSGPGACPFDLVWARSIVAQCREAGTAVFVKQMGDNAVMSTSTDAERGVSPARYTFRKHHGADPSEWPEDIRCQKFPEVRRV